MAQQSNEEQKVNTLALSTKELTKLPGYRLCWSQIKMMISNGSRFSDAEASALAAFAFLNKLNPTTGECWLLKPKNQEPLGCMVGIKGLRRKANDNLGPDHQFFVVYRDVAPDNDLILYQVKAELRDTKSMQNYLEMLQKATKMLQESGSPSPYHEAKEVVGPQPVWEGMGYFYKDEINSYKDKNYHPHNRAEKRAEAEAIKKRFDFDYSFGESEYEAMEATADVNTDAIDIQASDIKEVPPERIEAFLEGSERTKPADPNMEMPAESVPMKLKDYQRPMLKESVKSVVTNRAKDNLALGASLGKGTRQVISEAMNRIHERAEEYILQYIFETPENKPPRTMANIEGEEAEAVAIWFQTHMKEDHPVADLNVAIEAREIIDYMKRKSE